ncbi:MAG TPA: bifunctional phosphopantothenoylcysteine decarboxylase/phosphopantothenate--cysteine ligase CoaBC [Bacteroidota bacterium]|nr:bifunctional phosphopantothenoylcysteine decarboxylase/phosphopantothenate--cysteine ligase CoaBC [Bacteroidota bacterium]
MLKGKHIVVGITGGIAAYKIPLLIRSFRKAGADVRVVMTEAAANFVTSLTLSTLSGAEVVRGTFSPPEGSGTNAGTWHIKLGEWSDVMVIAPATANVVAKLAHGYADDAVTTLALAMRCPVVVSPAMDVDMWNHAATQTNIDTLQEMGYIVLPPEEGDLASGLTGKGRLPELEVIERATEDVLQNRRKDLKGVRILVTAGPTYEALDPVRFLGNRSSGKMGFALARAASERGAEVTLIAGQVHLHTPKGVSRINVESAQQMFEETRKCFLRQHAVIMTAAVADFAPVSVSKKKIKKEKRSEPAFSLQLRKTVDILHFLGGKKGKRTLIGFALETDNGLVSAKKKLKEKHLDMIVLNNPLEEGAGFGTDTNIVTLVSKHGKVERLKKMSKHAVADQILNRFAGKLRRK